MLNPHRFSDRLAVFGGLSLLAALIVPNAFAVEPMVDGGTGPADPGGDSAVIVDASSGGFDWSAALVVVLIGLVVLVTVLAVRHTAERRGSQLAAR